MPVYSRENSTHKTAASGIRIHDVTVLRYAAISCRRINWRVYYTSGSKWRMEVVVAYFIGIRLPGLRREAGPDEARGSTTGVQFLTGETMRFFPLWHQVQTDSGAHQTFYPKRTGGSFPGGKAVGA
jgi:hypothetical protein